MPKQPRRGTGACSPIRLRMEGAWPREAASGLAQILLEQQKYGDSEAVIRAALARDPDEPTLNAQLAAALIAEGKNEEALPPLQKVHDREPGNAAVNQMLADAYVQSGHPEKADPIYAAMVQARPDDPVLLGAQGKNLILEGAVWAGAKGARAGGQAQTRGRRGLERAGFCRLREWAILHGARSSFDESKIFAGDRS